MGSLNLTKVVFDHYGISFKDLRSKVEASGCGIDWGILKTDVAKDTLTNLLNLGAEQRQRMIIDYDRNYDYVLIRREVSASNELENFLYTSSVAFPAGDIRQTNL